MLFNDQMRDWCKMHDLVLNRAHVINQIAGEFAEVRGRAGRYRLFLFGAEVAEWRCYDLASVELAFQRADAAKAAVWHLCRFRGACAEQS